MFRRNRASFYVDARPLGRRHQVDDERRIPKRLLPTARSPTVNTCIPISAPASVGWSVVSIPERSTRLPSDTDPEASSDSATSCPRAAVRRSTATPLRATASSHQS